FLRRRSCSAKHRSNGIHERGKILQVNQDRDSKAKERSRQSCDEPASTTPGAVASLSTVERKKVRGSSKRKSASIPGAVASSDTVEGKKDRSSSKKVQRLFLGLWPLPRLSRGKRIGVLVEEVRRTKRPEDLQGRKGSTNTEAVFSI
ncbi:unnamed protein product, partial [Cylindrotheca closterium]